MPAFHQAFGFFQDDVGYPDVPFGRFVEGRSDHFGFYPPLHVGNFLGAFVDQQHDLIYFRVVGGDGVGNVLEQDGLTGFGLGDDHGALSFSDRGEQVDDARGGGGVFPRQAEFFLGKERSEVFEGDAVAHERGFAAIDPDHFYQREELLPFFGRANDAPQGVARFEPEEPDLGLGNIDVVRRSEIVVIRRTQESIAFRPDFDDTFAFDEPFEFIVG